MYMYIVLIGLNFYIICHFDFCFSSLKELANLHMVGSDNPIQSDLQYGESLDKINF